MNPIRPVRGLGKNSHSGTSVQRDRVEAEIGSKYLATLLGQADQHRILVEVSMLYKKINLELIVPADEADHVITELDIALDRMEERFTLFGGGTETVIIEHSGSRRKSALSHTLAAGKTAVAAVKTARERVSSALHLVI
jgi:hypothetical protein